MFGDTVRIEASTEVRYWVRGTFARLLLLWLGVGPPAVDGLTGAACCIYGERGCVRDGGGKLSESLDAVDKLDWLLSDACDREECDRWPDGECGRGGGCNGGRLFMLMYYCKQLMPK